MEIIVFLWWYYISLILHDTCNLAEVSVCLKKQLLLYILWTNFGKERLSPAIGNTLEHTVILDLVVHGTPSPGACGWSGARKA